MKTIKLLSLLTIGYAFLSMNSPIQSTPKAENNIDAFIKMDSVKYIVLTTQDSGYCRIQRIQPDKKRGGSFVFIGTCLAPGGFVFTTQDDVKPVTKSKAFLDSIPYLDWDTNNAQFSEEDGKKLKNFFVFNCYPWDGVKPKVKIYIIDRNDFSQDSIKMYEVYCRSAKYYYQEVIYDKKTSL